MKGEPVRIQEFHVPVITDRDQRMIEKGYREFFKRRGIDVGAGEGFRYLSAQDRLAMRRRAAALGEDGGAE